MCILRRHCLDRQFGPAVAIEAVERRLHLAAHVAGSSIVYATIQAAVDAASAGGTITVDAGAYPEQVTITKSLTLQGAQAGVDARSGGRPTASASTESVVTGAISGSVESSAFHILANDVTIDGFTVTGETNSDDALGAGIVIGPDQAGTHVVNDVITHNVAGLFLSNDSATDAALIQHCYFADNNNAGDNGGRGIYTDGTISGGDLTDVNIDSDTFYYNIGGPGTTYNEAAMSFEAAHAGEQSNIRITNNTITDCGKATLFFDTTNVLIEDNTVSGCYDQWSGIIRFEGNDNTVSILYNTVYGNRGPGVAVDSKGVPGDNYGFVVNYNNFYDNNTSYAVPISVAADFSVYDGAFDARYNYWGSASGPSGYGPGSGDAVGGGTYDPSNGWSLSPGGDMLYSPWSTATVTAPTVPAAPGGLTAVAASATQVNLSWTDNAAGNETGFLVQRSADDVTFAQIGATGVGVTSYSDTAGLSAGTTYFYRVLAVNSVGDSAASNTATAVTPTPPVVVAPAAPSGLTAVAASATQINLSWTDNAAGDETGFLIQRSTDGVTFAPIGTTSTGVTAYTDTSGLSAGATYYYRVFASNSAGNSTASNTATAVTPTPPPSTIVQFTGSVIGTSGSYQSDGNTIAKAVDGNVSTYFDAPTANGNWVGLDLGSTESGSEIKFAPRSGWAARMVGGIFQASSSATFSTGVVNLYTLTAAPAVGSLTTVTLSSPSSDRYFRYLSPAGSYGNIAEFQLFGPAPAVTARTGTVIGTNGSYENDGNTIAKVFDGNVGTFFDGATATGNWVGLDLGTAEAVSQISYAPRSAWTSRMVGGAFQSSTTANFSSGVTTLYTITTAPPAGSLTTISLASPVTARYFRYLSPTGSYGNIAEIVFAG